MKAYSNHQTNARRAIAKQRKAQTGSESVYRTDKPFAAVFSFRDLTLALVPFYNNLHECISTLL